MNITWPEEPKEDTILQELENEFKRLQSLEDENWKSVRVDNIDSLYDKMQYEYKWGTRLFYTVKDSNQYKDYIDLQASRGLPHPQDYNWDWDEYFKHVHMDERDLNENDIKRVDSLEKILLENIFKVETWNETFNHTSGGIRNFIEIGFRSPELLKVWKSKGLTAKGYDVVKSNVLVSKYLGYDVDIYDLNLCNQKLIIPPNSLIVSYHVLEHISNPMLALQTIYDAMDSTSFFHVEIPIEIYDTPDIENGHLQTFKWGDIQYMLESIGFKIVDGITHQDTYVEKFDHHPHFKDIITKTIREGHTGHERYLVTK